MPSRIARGSAARLRVELEDPDGEDLAGDVTVEVRDSLGILLAGGDADELGEGAYAFDLDAEKTATIDRLTATWSSEDAVAGRSEHDVVGGHFHTIKALRRMDPLEDADKYPTEQLLECRDLAAYALEEACHVAFVERFATWSAIADGGAFLIPRIGIREIRWATIAGESVDLETLSLATGGAVHGLELPEGSLVEVGFTFSLTEAPPARVARAARLIAREVAFEDEDAALSPRATSQSTDDGTFSLVTAGVAGAAFDLPEVNAVVSEYQAGYGAIARG